MAVLTTKDAVIKCDGTSLGKVVSASINISQEPVETTTVAVFYRTFIPGVKSASGSVTLLYDPNDAKAVTLLQSVLNGTSFVLSLTLNVPLGKGLVINAFVTQSSIPFAVREAFAITLSFQATGTIVQVL